MSVDVSPVSVTSIILQGWPQISKLKSSHFIYPFEIIQNNDFTGGSGGHPLTIFKTILTTGA